MSDVGEAVVEFARDVLGQPLDPWQEQIVRQAYAAPAEPIRTADAAELVGRPPGTIRYWGHRGWIRRLGRVGRQALWNRTDVLAAERDLRQGREPVVHAATPPTGRT